MNVTDTSQNQESPLNYAIFEGHHRGLKEIIKSLLRSAHAYDQAQGQPATKTEFAADLDRLQQFSALHFAEEEKFMDDIQFPSRPEHRGQHRDFLLRLQQIKEMALQPPSGAHDSALQWQEQALSLGTWWEEHALRYDRALADFLCRGGI